MKVIGPVNFVYVCMYMHLSTYPLQKFSLILIGLGGLGSSSLLTSGMKCVIFIGCLTVRFSLSDYKHLFGQFEPETAN